MIPPGFGTDSGINRDAGGIYTNIVCDSGGAGDLALVAAVLRKDRKATAAFVNTYTDAVYSYIRRRLSPRQDLVDDLVQEVFIAAWENLARFRGESSLRAWLL